MERRGEECSSGSRSRREGEREGGRRRSAAAVPADAAVPKQTHRGLPLLYNVKAGETFTLHS